MLERCWRLVQGDLHACQMYFCVESRSWLGVNGDDVVKSQKQWIDQQQVDCSALFERQRA
jgi:hypothetical protein